MRRFLLVALIFALVSGVCHAAIVTVVEDSAELRNSPDSVDSYVVLEVPRFYPLSVQEERKGFYNVRDYKGRRGWVRKSQVSETKGVVVEVDSVNVRTGPGVGHPVAFKAGQGVTFRVLGEEDGWLQVVHESGQRGWVSKALTWGQ